MRRRLLLGLFAGSVILAGAAVAGSAGVRWRLHLVALKAAGKVPELEWREMARMMGPRNRFYLEPLVATRNPYQSIRNPMTSPADVRAGEAEFRTNCSKCHGPSGEGALAPPLVGASLRLGSSDWALYRTISRGVPGTGMAPLGLSDRDRWQIIAWLQAARSRRRDSVEAAPLAGPARGPAPFIPAAALVNARATPGNWLTYSGAYDGWRYSPLDQIDRTNVHKLHLLWMYQFPEQENKIETSPLAVDGILFISGPTDRVTAIDAESGAVLWAYERDIPNQRALCCGRVNRGLAILDSTLYIATIDAHLVAVDAKSGKVRWDVEAADPARGYSFTSAPLAVGDLVVVGSAGGEYATRGFIDAYDARTGARRWRFHAIPEPGTPGSESWSGDSWKSGGGPAWLTGSYDPALGLLYWGIGNPNPDYDGTGRPGDNLFTNSVVALDAATGTLRWHFQFTPHDVHDWDSAQIPVLVNDPESGRPLLLWANRNGFYYVLDRATGKFLRARQFGEQTWAAGLDSTGRPRLLPGAVPTREGALVLPGIQGATNWWSPSYHPGTGLFYVPAYHRADVFYRGRTDDLPGPPGTRMGGGLNPARENSGRLTIRALDALTGERRWEQPVVDTMPRGSEYVGGLLSTAGKLVFGGGDDLLMALDAETGRRLWTFRPGRPVHAAPVTYLVNGRQRFTIAAGRALLTFGID